MSNTNVASFPFAPPTDTALTVASDNAQNTLNGDIDSTTTSIALLDASGFAVPCLIVIDAEVIRANGKTGDTFTNCERGFSGSIAASHTDTTGIFGYILAYQHNQMAAEVKSMGSYIFSADLSGFKKNENLLTYSEDFTQSYWIKSSGATITSSGDGLPNNSPALTLLEGSSSGLNMVSATAGGLSVGLQYTFTVYLKYDSVQWVAIGQHLNSSEARWAWFDLQNGVIGNVGNLATAVIVPIGDGWYRCMVITNCTVDSYKAFDICLTPSNGTFTYVGTSTNSALLSAAQVRSGGLNGPMSYIKTNGASFSLTGGGDLLLDEGDLS